MAGGFPDVLDYCGGTDVGGATATSRPTILSGTGTNTMGSFTQLVASLGVDAAAVIINIFDDSNTNNGAWGAVDLAVGGSGSEVLIATQLLNQCNKNYTSKVFLPLAIPQGSRVSARCQVATSGDKCWISLTAFDAGFQAPEGFSGVDSMGFTSGSTTGTTVTSSVTANTKGSYTQFSSSTPRDYSGLFCCAAGNTDILMDIAIGGSGSEKVIIPNIPIKTASDAFTPFYPVKILAGTRVAAAIQASTGGDHDACRYLWSLRITWTVDATGSQTAVISTEHVLDSPTTVGTYVLSVDTVNVALGDLVELRCYDMVDGTHYRQLWKGTYQHPQANVGKASPPLAVTTQAKFTLKQTAGTGRVFPWSVRRI